MHPKLEKLIETGIPVVEAHFHSAVNNADKVPENYFSKDSDNPNRRSEMYATTADLLVCKQKGRIFFTPMSNVRFGFFEKEE